ncbi:hypothetical protein ACLB2K_071287 [Fragaria x ananassa]
MVMMMSNDGCRRRRYDTIFRTRLRPKNLRSGSDDDAPEDQKRPELVDHDHKRRGVVIAGMPCHYFHEQCIVHWLEINHSWCLVCLYPMPTVEAISEQQP